MDKIRQQKLEYFLLDLDGKIKEIKDYLMLDKGAVLLNEMDKFEEENAEFLQYNPSSQDELNKRKWIIQYILFPIISDDKIEELLQYHLLEALSAELDLEELMKMRAITISELLWPKLSQQYLKALMQNTQLIGSNPIGLAGEKSSFLPYIKNWISLYNRRFGIDKHSGLEPHQFILEDPNAQSLGKSLKEKLLKVLRFYESLKVYSLSEIESELRKMQMGYAAQQAAAYSITKERGGRPANTARASSPNVDIPKKVKTVAKTNEGITAIQKEILQDKKIKIIKREYQEASPVKKKFVVPAAKEKEREVENAHILDLLEKYPALTAYKLTDNSISLPIAPFSLSPTIQNWIQYYAKECGKGKHSPQERDNFLELLKKNQNINSLDIQKLQKVFCSVDEKIPLPFDKNSNELLLDLVGVGKKLKVAENPKSNPNKLGPVMKMSGVGISRTEDNKKDEGYLDLELVPADSKKLKQQ